MILYDFLFLFSFSLGGNESTRRDQTVEIETRVMAGGCNGVVR